MTNTETLKEIQEILNSEFINSETGEVLTGKELGELTQLEKGIKRTNQLNKYHNKTALQELIFNEYGTFFFTNYKEVLNSFVTDKGSFDSALAFRFIYLSTFMDYDNNLMFGLPFRGKDRGRMNIKDLREVMGLSRNQITKFRKALTDLDLLFIDSEGNLSINKRCCKKGNLKKSTRRDFIRCFEEGVQEIYQNSTAKEHKRLGYFIQLLPYVNYNHSILCWNPEEIEANKIQPLTIQDICKILNISVSHARRTERDLYKITINGQHLLGKFIYYSAEVFIINPAVYYKGNDLTALKGIMNLFNMVNK